MLLEEMSYKVLHHLVMLLLMRCVVFYSQDSEKKSNKPTQQPIKSFDFRTWDKYDAESAAKQAKEDDKEEEEDSSKGAPAIHLPAVVSERGIADYITHLQYRAKHALIKIGSEQCMIKLKG